MGILNNQIEVVTTTNLRNFMSLYPADEISRFFPIPWGNQDKSNVTRFLNIRVLHQVPSKSVREKITNTHSRTYCEFRFYNISRIMQLWVSTYLVSGWHYLPTQIISTWEYRFCFSCIPPHSCHILWACTRKTRSLFSCRWYFGPAINVTLFFAILYNPLDRLANFAIYSIRMVCL